MNTKQISTDMYTTCYVQRKFIKGFQVLNDKTKEAQLIVML